MVDRAVSGERTDTVVLGGGDDFIALLFLPIDQSDCIACAWDTYTKTRTLRRKTNSSAGNLSVNEGVGFSERQGVFPALVGFQSESSARLICGQVCASSFSVDPGRVHSPGTSDGHMHGELEHVKK